MPFVVKNEVKYLKLTGTNSYVSPTIFIWRERYPISAQVSEPVFLSHLISPARAVSPSAGSRDRTRARRASLHRRAPDDTHRPLPVSNFEYIYSTACILKRDGCVHTKIPSCKKPHTYAVFIYLTGLYVISEVLKWLRALTIRIPCGPPTPTPASGRLPTTCIG